MPRPLKDGKPQPELDFKNDTRRQMVLRLRMKFPPLSIRQMAVMLKCSTKTVMDDIRYLRTQFSAEYFAENNRAAVARACAELESMAHQFLTEAEQLPLRAYATEKAALYGRALQALQQRNDIMMEAGIITKVPLKIETSGPDGKPIQYDVSTASVEDRIRMLQLAKAKPEPLTPEEDGS